MITATGIKFHHYRNENRLDTKDGRSYIANLDFGPLDVVGVKQISISKESQKEYTVQGNQKSFYLPLGMVGPIVNLVCHVDDHAKWSNVYSNDYLKIEEFGFPVWNKVLGVGTSWWVSSISLDTQLGFIHNGKLRYEMTLELYRKMME